MQCIAGLLAEAIELLHGRLLLGDDLLEQIIEAFRIVAAFGEEREANMDCMKAVTQFMNRFSLLVQGVIRRVGRILVVLGWRHFAVSRSGLTPSPCSQLSLPQSPELPLENCLLALALCHLQQKK